MSGEAGDGYGADPDALAAVAKGLNDVIDELKAVTGEVGGSGVGRGFEDLALTGLQLGSSGLTEAFNGFCERWEWGVRSLVQEAAAFAEGLGLSAGRYNDMEEYAKGTIKVALNAAAGNPHLTEKQAENMSVDQVAADMQAWRHPDYSLQLQGESVSQVKQVWKDTGRDVAADIDEDNVDRFFGVSGKEWDAAKDNVFGPSPEERTKQAEQTQPGGQS